MTAESLAGVRGAARRHRGWRNTGGSAWRGVATLGVSSGQVPRWASEGRTVPFGLTGRNRLGGKAPWFGARLNEPRGGRLA
jgi:hypothetical protein